MIERSDPGGAVFNRVVCGIDGSPEEQEASREASLLAADGAHLFLVEVLAPAMVGSLATAIPGGTTAPGDAGRATARADTERAQVGIRDAVEVAVTIRVGPSGAILQGEAVRMSADTMVVGSNGHGRAVGVLLGSVATRLNRETGQPFRNRRSGMSLSSKW
jgi:nucleotide-binding universal stress UspA family protein